MRDFIRFETMITPMLIAFLFWLAVIACVVIGVWEIAAGPEHGVGVCLTLIILGPLVIRIYAEILMVVFRINDHLRQIVHNTQRT